MSNQGFIINSNNNIVNADITATVKASDRKVLVYPLTKQGSGDIDVYGDYANDDDAQFEIKIASEVSDTPNVSNPIFTGAGTADIENITINGLTSQQVTVECESTGIDSTYAFVYIGERKYIAKTTGYSGNNIEIEINEDNLTENTYVGEGSVDPSVAQYGVPLTPLNLAEGTEFIPDNGEWYHFDLPVVDSITSGLPIYGNEPGQLHRIKFGEDNFNIYIMYKFETNIYFYPSIQVAVASGTQAYFISGGREITITDGTTTNTYENIRSYGEFCNNLALDDNSLIEPTFTYSDNRYPNSIMVEEFKEKTIAYAKPIEFASGNTNNIYLEDIEVNELFDKQERLKIECIEATPSPLFNITSYQKDPNTGLVTTIEDAPANQVIEFPDTMNPGQSLVSFVIPYAETSVDTGDTSTSNWSQVFVPHSSGVYEDSPIAYCFDAVVGRAALQNTLPYTITFEYGLKPTTCDCYPYAFDLGCVGQEGGDSVSRIIPNLTTYMEFQLNYQVEADGSRTYAQEKTVRTALNKTFSLFKTAATYLMGFPENDTATLTSMLNNFYTLIQSISAVSGTGDLAVVTYNTNIYTTLMNQILEYDRLYGQKKISYTTTDCGCYQSNESASYYWKVTGDKNYMPAYTDLPYYSTESINGGEDCNNTYEFAVLIESPCSDQPFEKGDKILFTIYGVDISEQGHTIGDIIYLPIQGAAPIQFDGGVSGNDQYTFGISSSLDDINFVDFIYDKNGDNSQSYQTSNLIFDINIQAGDQAFSVGDKFVFDIESGQWQWRQQNGVWSNLADIQSAIQNFPELPDSSINPLNGLKIGFQFGTAPSFVENDRWELLCYQNHKVTNLTDIDTFNKYIGTKTDTYVDVVLDMLAISEVECLIIASHNIENTIQFNASNDIDFSSGYSINITPETVICRSFFDDNLLQYRYYRIRLTDSEPEIGYIFLGNIIRVSLESKLEPIRTTNISRTSTKRMFSLTNYAETGYKQSYSLLTHEDFDKLDTIYQYVKVTNNNQDLFLIPNIQEAPNTAIRGKLETDSLEVTMNINSNAPELDRLYGISNFNIINRTYNT